MKEDDRPNLRQFMESFDSQKWIDVMNKDMKFMHKTDSGILKH